MRTLENLQLEGGCLIFDFANTVNTRRPAPVFDYLKTFDDFLKWSAKVGSLRGEQLEALRKLAALRPETAQVVLHDVTDTREIFYQLFSAIAAGMAPDAAVTSACNNRLSLAFQKIHIKFGPAGPEIHLSNEEISLDEPLLPVIRSAFDILTLKDFRRIKECPRCGWLFLDTSKNGKRKWCDMNLCGSREKSLEYYYRKTKPRHHV